MKIVKGIEIQKIKHRINKQLNYFFKYLNQKYQAIEIVEFFWTTCVRSIKSETVYFKIHGFDTYETDKKRYKR